ncbi:MAG: ABC transporter permease [Solirubrobacterales bacterium]|nr:ABC transporter permease [Solirubrobacterales bacterium]
MRSVAQYLDAVGATVKRDAAVFVSYRFRFVSQLLTMLLTMTMFYYISKLVRPGVVGPQGRYFAYVVVGIVSLSVLTAALNTGQLVRMELLTGTFERVVISPVGPVGGIIALSAFPILYAIVLAGLMLVAAAGIFAFPVHVAGIPAALGVSALAALAFTCIGLVFIAGLLAFKSTTGASWAIAGLSILGGVYFPLTLFPGWMRWVSDVQPFTPAVDLVRHLLLGTTPSASIWLELVKLGGFTVALMPLSAWVLGRAVQMSRRRGTLMEY